MPICLPNQTPCAPLPIGSTPAQIISHFQRCSLPALNAQLNWFASQRTLLSAIRRAAIARGSTGNRLSHQWRLPRAMYPSALKNLTASAPALKRCATFSDLYAVIDQAVGSLSGVGPLYIYDTALRIDAFLQIQPTDVYLQAGALKGAERLLNRVRSRALPPTAFPTPYSALAPYQLENLLCCYRRWL
jgi:hypothetical protein